MDTNERRNNNIRLIDEALVETPIENTFRLAWEFVKLNKNFTFTAMGVFVGLNLLGAIPVLSLIFSTLVTMFAVVIQIHVGRTFYAAQDIKNYISEIQESTVEKIVTQHTSTSFGVYLGWLVLIVAIVFIFAFIAAGTGVINQNMNETDMFIALAGLSAPFIIVALIFSYVQPLVYSNIILANSLGEGFKAVFSFFSKDVWSSAMKKGYFAYVAKIGLILVGVTFLVVIIFGSLTMLPILGIFGTVLILLSMYVLIVIMSVMAMIARRIVEE